MVLWCCLTYAQFFYKTTEYYAPQHNRTILWNDPNLAITWPIQYEPIVSAKDKLPNLFSEAEVYL
jgi:dTDP-4-dehydrorhamnose 3,5-epimerase